ncbi:MAG TPA: NADH-quinone oxidoreductase subunit N [Candidatus Nanoarchaeia archaeon]|nr:NADH-quinone oxidoreductase subunit N [Candidatus Nanoarchaeia archaeon]
MISVYDVAYPIIALVAFALLTIPVFRFIRKTSHKTVLTLVWFALVFAVAFAAVANLANQYYQIPLSQSFVNITLSNTPASPAVSSSFMIDGISIYMSIIAVVVSAVVMLYCVFYINPAERPSERYFALMLLMTAAIIGAVCAGDLLTLFIFWEIAASGSCFLMLYKKNRMSLNASLKYIIMVVIASAFIVFGLSLIYGITGTLNFWAVKAALLALNDKTLLIIALIFMSAGYAIEAAIVPFHFWLPDAYNAAPASSSAFLSALVDQGSYYVLIRVLIFILTPTGALDWRLMLAFMAAFTMIVGNMFALIQGNVKMLIGNICVADVGYNLVAITSVTALGLQGNLYFFLIGGLTTALAFMAVGVINHFGFKTLDDFAGVGRKIPLASFALLIAAFSFAGVPPLGGFIAKYLVFTAAIESNFTWLAVIGVLMSVVQTAYLFRLVNVMYAKKPKDETRIKEPVKLLVPIFILVGALVILGLFPSIVLDPMQRAVEQLPRIVQIPSILASLL